MEPSKSNWVNSLRLGGFHEMCKDKIKLSEKKAFGISFWITKLLLNLKNKSSSEN